jgi:type IV pilus assembly protein PilE
MYMNHNHSRTRGFTLIELVIAMLIAATLAAIAIPSYSNYVRKSRRVEARSALLDMASLQERYFSTQNAYSAAPSDLGFSGTYPVTVGNGYYQVAAPAFTVPASVPTATSAGVAAVITMTATTVATSDQAKDTTCATFVVKSDGTQSSQNAGGTDTTATCWH